VSILSPVHPIECSIGPQRSNETDRTDSRPTRHCYRRLKLGDDDAHIHVRG